MSNGENSSDREGSIASSQSILFSFPYAIFVPASQSLVLHELPHNFLQAQRVSGRSIHLSKTGRALLHLQLSNPPSRSTPLHSDWEPRLGVPLQSVPSFHPSHSTVRPSGHPAHTLPVIQPGNSSIHCRSFRVEGAADFVPTPSSSSSSWCAAAPAGVVSL